MSAISRTTLTLRPGRPRSTPSRGAEPIAHDPGEAGDVLHPCHANAANRLLADNDCQMHRAALVPFNLGNPCVCVGFPIRVGEVVGEIYPDVTVVRVRAASEEEVKHGHVHGDGGHHH